jgi:putative PEP-CTERM system TPR-repeat lipoprotein
VRVAATASILLSVSGCDLFVSEQARFDRATAAWSQGDLRTARIELKKLLEKNPNRADAWLLLGQVSLRGGTPAAGEAELRRASELGAPADEVVVPLGEALLSQGLFDQAVTALEPSAVRNASKRLDVLELRAEALIALGRAAEAAQTNREVLAQRPNSLAARIGLAQVEQSTGNAPAAEAYVREALATDPSYAPGWLAKGLLDLHAGRDRDAEDALARSLSVGSLRTAQEFAARTGLAESQWRQGKSGPALDTVTKLLEFAPQHPQPKYMRALIAYGAGDYDTAKRYLQEVVRGRPDHRAAAFLLGATHYAQGELEQASVYLKSALTTDAESMPVRKLLAATNLKRKRPQDAIAALAPLADRSKDSGALALLGEASLLTGDSRTGLFYLERALAASPQDVPLQLQAATAYVTTGHLDQAIELLTKMPETEAGAAGRDLLLALAYLRKGDQQEALAYVQQHLAHRPDSAAAHSLAGSVYLTLSQTSQARTHYENALRLQPDSTTVLMNLGRLAVREGKSAEARARFERVVALSPNHADAMLALAQLDAEGNLSSRKRWLERASAANPQATEPKLLLIRLCLETGDRDQARSLARELVAANPADAAAQNALGVVQTADGDLEQAALTFRKAVAAAPRSADLVFNLARAELALERRDKAQKLLVKALQLEPDHSAAVALLATLELQEGKADTALARARTLQQGQDTAAAGLVLEGDLRMLQRKFDQAAIAYESALKRAPSGPLAARSYEARVRAGAPNPADPLVRWVRDNRGDVGARRILASEYQRQGQLSQAAAEYEQLLEQRPDDAVSLNNLAWVYFELKDPRAIPTAERAHALRPEAGAITDTLGWLLVQSGQLQRGLPLLRQAAQQAPNLPDIRYHLAVALVQSGQRDEARTTLTELLSSGQGFKELPSAKRLLAEL